MESVEVFVKHNKLIAINTALSVQNTDINLLAVVYMLNSVNDKLERVSKYTKSFNIAQKVPSRKFKLTKPINQPNGCENVIHLEEYMLKKLEVLHIFRVTDKEIINISSVDLSLCSSRHSTELEFNIHYVSSNCIVLVCLHHAWVINPKLSKCEKIYTFKKNNFKPLCMGSIFDSPESTRVFMLFTNNVEIVTLDVKFEQGDKLAISNLSCHLFPSMYLSIISCIKISIGQNSTLAVESADGPCSRCIFATVQKQLLLFEFGKLVNCRGLDVIEPNAISTLFSSSGYELVVLTDSLSNILILHAVTFEILYKVENVGYWTCSDFIKCGAEQLLVLRSRMLQEEETITEFLLTDLNKWHIDNFTMGTQPSDVSGENNLSIVSTALEKQMQTSVRHLRDLVKQCTIKQSFVSEMEQNINRMLGDLFNGNKTANHTQKTPLLAIGACRDTANVTGDDSGDCNNHVHDDDKNGDARVKCGPVWKKICDENFVIGISMLNNSLRRLHNTRLLLLPGSTHAGNNNLDVHYHAFADTGGPSSSKKARLQESLNNIFEPPKSSVQYLKKCTNCDLQPQEIAHLTVTGRVPTFDTTMTQQFSIIVQWQPCYECEVNRCSDTHRECVRRSGLQSVCVGDITISTEDILSTPYGKSFQSCVTGTDAIRHYLTLESIQVSQRLSIESTHSILDDFTGILSEQLGFIQHKQLDCYMCTPPGPLYCSRIQLLKRGKNSVQIRIHCSSDSNILLLVHALYKHLPDDVIILAAEMATQCMKQRTATSRLYNETNSVVGILKTTLEEKRNRDSVSMNAANIEPNNVFEIRKDFQEKQVAFSATNDGTNSDIGLDKFYRKKSSLEFNTDQAMKWL